MLLAWNTEEHDMIFRAVFWIGLVSLLTPHEFDLGLGRPGAGTLPPPPPPSCPPLAVSRGRTRIVERSVPAASVF